SVCEPPPPAPVNWLIFVPLLIWALVVIKNTSTMIEPLTAAPPLDAAAASATDENLGRAPMIGTTIGSASLIEDFAETSTLPAATLAPPLSSEEPPAPARPQTISWFVLPPVLTASIVIPSPVMTASWPTVALLVMSSTSTPTAAATCVPSELAERPVDWAAA